MNIVDVIYSGPLRPPITGDDEVVKRLPNEEELRELWGIRNLEPYRRYLSKGAQARYRRSRIEGGGKFRKNLLERIYIRDKATCYRCGDYVKREDASREHLFRPLKEFPHLARNDIYIALAHRWCNQ